MAAGSPSITGGGRPARAVSSLRDEPVEVLLPVFGTFAVARLLVVAGAAREISRQRVLGARNRAVADAVAVDVLVTLELPQPLQVLGVQDLAALDAAWWGYGNGSLSQRFMPRSRSVATKTGVWNCWARSSASMVSE